MTMLQPVNSNSILMQPPTVEEVSPSPAGDPRAVYLLYEHAGQVTENSTRSFGDCDILEVFRPSLLRMKPYGIPVWPFLVYYLLHVLRFFRSRDYAVYLVRQNGQYVHYTTVLPKFFRHPDAALDDLIIGPSWTHPEHRRHGLAHACLVRILKDYEGRHHWYFVRKANLASQLVAAKAGMHLTGEAYRTKWVGIRLLGSFVPMRPNGRALPLHPRISQATKQELDKGAEKQRFDKRSSSVMSNGTSYDWRSGAQTMPSALRGPYLFMEHWIDRLAPGKRVLDYGCGHGIYSILPAARGADVIGLDFSPHSIALARERACREGVSNHCNFLVGDCERLPFADASFDMVLSCGTFCSLRQDWAFAELARVTRPDGCVFLVDTLGHNPLLNLNRRLLLWRGRRTYWEVKHILKVRDLQQASRYFRRMEVRFFDLTTPILALLGRGEGRFFRVALGLLEEVDRWLLRIPLVNRLSFKCAYILYK